MPFTCEVCGHSSWPDLMPAVDNALRCRHCGGERPFVKPPLLVVTGTAGVGKSTLCARLAGTIPGSILLDADIFAEHHVSVVAPNQDYQAFWLSMMHLAHEIAQNNLVVVYFSTMLPGQVLANTDELDLFDSVHFLCLHCPPDALTDRLIGRDGARATARLEEWRDFSATLVRAADEVPTATVMDAGRPADDVERDARGWITTLLRRLST